MRQSPMYELSGHCARRREMQSLPALVALLEVPLQWANGIQTQVPQMAVLRTDYFV
jgi:hypothetical protein